MSLPAVVALTLAWTAPPEGATEYHVYRGIDRVRVSSEARATLELPIGESITLTVTAVGPGGESAHSEPFTVFIVDSSKGKLTIQGSADLEEWQDIPKPGDRFFRIKIDR
jgi:hypothetical protein